MSLVGTYVNLAQNFKLVVKEANDADGNGTGTFEWGPFSIPVTIHYHFENSGGPETNLWFAGATDDPNEYIGGAGYTSNEGYASIQVGVSFSTIGRVDTFATRLDRE